MLLHEGEEGRLTAKEDLRRKWRKIIVGESPEEISRKMLNELDNAANSEYGEFLMKLLAVASPYPYKCSYMAFTLHCAP
jgi:hypothetical protein